MNPTVTLRPAAELAVAVASELARVIPLIAELIPDAYAGHVGATAVPGALTKGDVDLVVRVAAHEFPRAVAALRQRFTIKQPENWDPFFASFGDDAGVLPVGIQLVVRDSEADFFVWLRDHMRQYPSVLEHYNRMKLGHAAEGSEAYWQAKHEFLTAVLLQRPKCPDSTATSIAQRKGH
jgi:GrpB-like predicted nucleotidyltransferase (UPF0157 family)